MKIKAVTVVALLMTLAGCSASIWADDAGVKNPANAKSGYVANQTGTTQSGVSAAK
ncbi:MAG: hypothetical protein WCI90_01700 [Chlorobium sp.]